jgi:hypothetical protein
MTKVLVLSLSAAITMLIVSVIIAFPKEPSGKIGIGAGYGVGASTLAR